MTKLSYSYTDPIEERSVEYEIVGLQILQMEDSTYNLQDISEKANHVEDSFYFYSSEEDVIAVRNKLNDNTVNYYDIFRDTRKRDKEFDMNEVLLGTNSFFLFFSSTNSCELFVENKHEVFSINVLERNVVKCSFKTEIDAIELYEELSKEKEGIGIQYLEPNFTSIYKLERWSCRETKVCEDDAINLNEIIFNDAVIPESSNEGNGVAIAILDQGIDLTHPVFKSIVKSNYWQLDVFNEGKDLIPYSGDFHGTMVASIIQGKANINCGKEYTGIANQSKIIGCRIMKGCPSCYGLKLDPCNVVKGIKLAIGHGVQIINCSWKLNYNSRYCLNTINSILTNSDVLFVCASGNNIPEVAFPANHPKTLSVAGGTVLSENKSIITDDQGLCWFSSYKGPIDVVAPSIDIWAAKRYRGFEIQQPNKHYKSFFGTSVAAPIVSAALAMYISRHGSIDLHKAKDLLKRSSDTLTNPSSDVTAGFLNVTKLLLTK